MTEEEARSLLDVSRETMVKLEEFVALLVAENERQNLVSRSTVESIWTRHILDSAQLARLAPATSRSWIDIGSGAGLPGIVTSLLLPDVRTTLVEPRKLRVEFLHHVVSALELEERIRILPVKVAAVPAEMFDVISARAFAPLASLFASAEHFAAPETRWVLPKGRNAKSELEEAESLWQGAFRLEPSLTDEDARIIVAEQVRRKPRGRRGR
jgi:16S rRNA (guanine527-N7)-methyltransferase